MLTNSIETSTEQLRINQKGMKELKRSDGLEYPDYANGKLARARASDSLIHDHFIGKTNYEVESNNYTHTGKSQCIDNRDSLHLQN